MRIFILLAILLAIDIYVFQGVKVLVSGRDAGAQRIAIAVFWGITVFVIGAILSTWFFDWRSWPRTISTYLFAFIVIIYLSKIFVLPFLLIDDLIRLGRWTASLFSSPAPVTEGGTANGITRYAFLVRMGFIVGAVPFVSMIYGMIKGATDFTVRRHRRNFANLPESFNGFRIVQISDMHLGSFFSEEPVQRAIDLIMKQKPDVILFTGDLVNDLCDEAVPYTGLLKQLSAPHGVYSVLGNHDYGEYYRWPDQEQKHQNLERLIALQRSLGWKLLINEHDYIERNGEQLGIIGVENWSGRMNFQRYGDMEKATEGMRPVPFNILMSHDPSHWHGRC
jgi:predicted MPP superfamily phosphohydrolase